MPWLEQLVPLPAGYKTTRRDALKFVSLAAALSSVGVMITRAKVCSGAIGPALDSVCSFGLPSTAFVHCACGPHGRWLWRVLSCTNSAVSVVTHTQCSLAL